MAQFGPPENATLQNIGADGARWSIAWQQTAARQPGAAGAIWLSGLMSDMASGKASHLANWAETAGIAFTRFDFRGHGQSGGRFEEAAASDWLSDARLVLEQVTTGPQVLVGSSMGGWIALLLARAMIAAGGASAGRIAGIVLIAPAWDMTERLMWAEATPEQRRAIETVGVWQPPSAYGDTPYPITRRLIDDGRTLCLAGRPLDIGVPDAHHPRHARHRCALARLGRTVRNAVGRRRPVDPRQGRRAPVVASSGSRSADEYPRRTRWRVGWVKRLRATQQPHRKRLRCAVLGRAKA